jgi:tRNA G18 (ribose-2'-O)-methylase SpoU
MDVEVVDDADDPRLDWFRLRDRVLADRPARRDDGGAGHFLAESDLVVERALAAGCRPVAALVDPARPPAVAARLGVELLGAGEELRRRVTGLGRVQPILVVFERPPRRSLDDVAQTARRLVVLEAVDNPANVGAALRSAAALGWHGLVLDRTSADPLARRALRVAMGTAFTMPHARVGTVAEALAVLARRAFTTVALTPAGDAPELRDVTVDGPVALLAGAERAGLAPATLAACDVRARIPMHAGVDSVNVAAALAVACYALGPAGSGAA